MKKDKPKLIVICGPTASGKTEMAVSLCKKFNGEIISADSRQIYKEMNIATAKVLGDKKTIDGEEVVLYKEISHYLVDIISPCQEYHLAKFQKDVYRIAEKIISRGKVPFLVGGTGLYIQSIVDNYSLPEGEVDNELRKNLEMTLNEKGLEILSKELEFKYPTLSKSVNLKNPRHVIRALEIGEQFGDIKKEEQDSVFDILELGINIEREELYNRINHRVDKMMELGVLEETKKLLEKYNEDLPAMSGIGYRQLISFLKNEINLEEAIEIFKRDTRRYAKRQMTWFRRNKEIVWIKSLNDAVLKVENFLKS